MVPSGSFELLFLLLDTLLNVSSHLVDFQTQPQEFVFFLLQSSFCISQSSFKLKLLLFKFLPLLFNFMNVPSTFADLFHQVLDFIRKCFVLSTNIIKLNVGFLITILDSEELSRSI